jgi:hypothetical protein
MLLFRPLSCFTIMATLAFGAAWVGKLGEGVKGEGILTPARDSWHPVLGRRSLGGSMELCHLVHRLLASDGVKKPW